MQFMLMQFILMSVEKSLRNRSITKCREFNLCVYKSLCWALYHLQCQNIFDLQKLMELNPSQVAHNGAVMDVLCCCFMVQVWLKTEVLHSPSLTWPGFELMTSRSWQYLSCHWDACSNHLTIIDFSAGKKWVERRQNVGMKTYGKVMWLVYWFITNDYVTTATLCVKRGGKSLEMKI